MSISLVPRLNYKYTVSDFLISVRGLFKRKFDDQALKQIFGVNEIFFYNHARTALRIALSSLKLKSNAKIGLAGFNCLTVMNSVKSAGYDLVFIDITDDFQLDLSDLSSKIEEIDALIINHMFGIPNKSILEIKEKYPLLPIIEDCAHSFLSKLNGKFTGLYGDISVFSFGRAKFPSVGDGGFMLVNNLKYKSIIENENNTLKSTSVTEELNNILTSIILSILHKPIIYKNISLKFLKSIDNQKDVAGKYSTKESSFFKSNRYLLLSKTKKINKLLQIQIENGHRIIDALPSKFNDLYEEYNFFMFPLFLNRRDEFIKLCSENGIETGKHFAKTIQWAKEFGYLNGSCPNAEKIANIIVTLPTYLNSNQISKLTLSIKAILNEKNTFSN